MTGNTLARLNRAVVELTTGRHDPDADRARSRPTEGYRLFSQFTSTEETARWLALIEAQGGDWFARRLNY